MTLTRKEMEAVIDGGGSVLHGVGTSRRIIDRKEDLPGDAELASGNREELQKARDALAGRIDKLTAEVAAIDHEIATLGSAKAGQKAASVDAEGADGATAEEQAAKEHGTDVETAKRGGKAS